MRSATKPPMASASMLKALNTTNRMMQKAKKIATGTITSSPFEMNGIMAYKSPLSEPGVTMTLRLGSMERPVRLRSRDLTLNSMWIAQSSLLETAPTH